MVKVFLFDDLTPFGREKVNYLSIASGLFALSCHIIKFSFVSPSKSNTATKLIDNKRTAPRPIPELPPKTYLLVSSMVKTYD